MCVSHGGTEAKPLRVFHIRDGQELANQQIVMTLGWFVIHEVMFTN